MLSKGLLVVLSAPSGGGKTSLRSGLRKRMPDMLYSVSVTTRGPRREEVDGKDYFFVGKEVFQNWIENGKFFEWAEVHGNLYGTPREFIEENLSKGKGIVLDVDVQGALKIKKKFPEAMLVFIAPPSIGVLRKRLQGRGTDKPEDVRKRVLKATDEMSVAKRYDHLIINEDLEDALTELEMLVRKYREYKR